jgi:hypothetical protein
MAIKRRVTKTANGISIGLGPNIKLGGRTNATNPGSLNRLEDAFDDLMNAQATKPQRVNPPPTKTMPSIHPQFTKMGEALGTCPHELQVVMNTEYKVEDTLVFTLFKNFVMAAKLSGSVDLKPVHKVLKGCEERHAREMETWTHVDEMIKQKNKDAAVNLKNCQKAFDTTWGDILIDLTTKLERNPKIDSLGDWDKLMVLALNRRGEEYCMLDIKKAEALLDFNKCKTLDATTVMSLPKVASQIGEEIEQAKWQIWIGKATTEELLEELWKTSEFEDHDDHVNDGRLEQLEWAIVAKSGRIPLRDRNGRIDWAATMSQDDNLSDEVLEHQYQLAMKSRGR